MKHLSEDTRVLVANGAYALVLRNDGDGAFPNLRLERAYEQDNPATREQGSDKPGRMNDSLGPHIRHGEQPTGTRSPKTALCKELPTTWRRI